MAASMTKTTFAAAPAATPRERPLHDYLKEVSDHTGVRVGSALPLGTSQQETGANFAFFSRHATRVRLELFDRSDEPASRRIDLDPARNRTGDVWHVWVDGIRPGQLYAYRADGPYAPGEGQRFNFSRILLDPFATAVSRLVNWDFGKAYACLIQEARQNALLMIFNACTDGIAFHLPPLSKTVSWRLGEDPTIDGSKPYSIEARCSAILLARKKVT